MEVLGAWLPNVWVTWGCLSSELLPHILVLLILLITIIYFSQWQEGEGKILFCLQPSSHMHLQGTICQLLNYRSLPFIHRYRQADISQAHLQISASLPWYNVRHSLKRDLNKLSYTGCVIYLPRHTQKCPLARMGVLPWVHLCCPHDWRVFHEPRPASVLPQIHHRQSCLPLFANLLTDRLNIKWGKVLLGDCASFLSGKIWPEMGNDSTRFLKDNWTCLF